jgi:hypothetical protein
LQLAWTVPKGSIALIPTGNLSTSTASVTGSLAGSWWNGDSGVWYPTGQAAFSFSNPNLPNNHASTFLNNQGSVVGAAANTFSYTSTTTSITWTWSAFTAYNPDGSTLSVAANTGGTAFTGLTSSTTYYFGFYVVVSTGVCHVVLSAASSGTAACTAQQIATVFNGDGNDGVNWNVTAATTSSGSGGGSGGGIGGGGCFTGNTRIVTAHGVRPFHGYVDGQIIQIVNETGTFDARVIVHENFHETMLDMGGGELVTMGHLVKNADGIDVPAIELFPNAPRIDFSGTVYNLSVLGDDPHYVLENGVVAHNVKMIE